MALSGRRLQETVRQTIKTQCKFQARSRCLSITRPNSSSEHHTRPKFDAETAFKLTQPPFPGWKVGTGLDDTETRWGEEGKESRKTWSLSDLSSRYEDAFWGESDLAQPCPQETYRRFLQGNISFSDFCNRSASYRVCFFLVGGWNPEPCTV